MFFGFKYVGTFLCDLLPSKWLSRFWIVRCLDVGNATFAVVFVFHNVGSRFILRVS